jgi:Zn-dependent peptidase ImmA (M78 family)/transcriptional regulator with XRE-family HTH domain
MSSELAYINPEILKWARTRLQLSTRETAEKSAVKPEKLAKWEEGEAKPTWPQAKKIARVLRVPFGYFFLSSPPKEAPPIPDLRTVADDRRNTFSPDFLEVLNDVLLKHDWYKSYAQALGTERLPFIGRFTVSSRIPEVAEHVRTTLGINEDFRRQAANWTNFLVNLIDRVEEAGILVLRSGIVKNDTRRSLSVREFRGFVITDPVVPLIFINAKDAKAAQIFTLVHELVHVWIGQSGISNPDLGRQEISADQRIERFCNQVTAEVLVPEQLFAREWVSFRDVDANAQQLARRFKVSSLVVLRRAFDLRYISWDEYSHHYDQHLRRIAALNERQKSGRGDFYATLKSRNSRRIIQAVLSETFENRLSYRDAAQLLGVKPAKLETVAEVFGIK